LGVRMPSKRSKIARNTTHSEVRPRPCPAYKTIGREGVSGPFGGRYERPEQEKKEEIGDHREDPWRKNLFRRNPERENI